MITGYIYSPEEQSIRKQSEDMRQLYRNVFSSPEGIRVLGDILATCHFGVPINNESERVEYNVGVTIARMSGMMGEIDALLKIGED